MKGCTQLAAARILGIKPGTVRSKGLTRYADGTYNRAEVEVLAIARDKEASSHQAAGPIQLSKFLTAQDPDSLCIDVGTQLDPDPQVPHTGVSFLDGHCFVADGRYFFVINRRCLAELPVNTFIPLNGGGVLYAYNEQWLLTETLPLDYLWLPEGAPLICPTFVSELSLTQAPARTVVREAVVRDVIVEAWSDGTTTARGKKVVWIRPKDSDDDPYVGAHREYVSTSVEAPAGLSPKDTRAELFSRGAGLGIHRWRLTKALSAVF